MVKRIRLRKTELFPGGYGRRESNPPHQLRDKLMLYCNWCGGKAQTVLEYAAVIMCLVAALLAMQVYLKRSMQGRLRQLGDELGQQYAPRNTTGNQTLVYNSATTTVARTLSEKEINVMYPDAKIDLNGDGDYTDENIFATETFSTLDHSNTTQKQEETVGPLESSLF